MRIRSFAVAVWFGLCIPAMSARAQGAPEIPACGAARDSVVVLWCQGGAAWLRKDVKGAIDPYSRAFAMEKRKRSLGQTAWRVLLDNLGMAYGMTGELEKSQQLFEFGVAQDPDYPLFRYNLACVFAEREDWQASIRYLGQAFARKANMNHGEEMPDPWTDDSFQRFMRNPQFTAALTKIRPRS